MPRHGCKSKPMKDMYLEIADLRRALETAQSDLDATRRSHAKLCRGIKTAIGYKNWPMIPGNFMDGVLRLMKESLARRRKRKS